MYESFGTAEKLVMRIQSLKWLARTRLAAAAHPRERAEIAVILDELDGLEVAARATTAQTLDADEQRVDTIGRRLMNMAASETAQRGAPARASG